MYGAIRISLILFYISSFCFLSSANNIQIANVSTTGHDPGLDITFVEFDLSWDNSWRNATLEKNWDAAWVFVKYRKKSENTWNHATFSTSGHVAPSGSTIDSPADGMGVFIYRDADGTGSVNFTTIQIQWDYAADGLTDNEAEFGLEVSVHAVEMVYVPQGNFEAGDGAAYRSFYTHPSTTVPYTVSSENAITIGTTAGNMNYVSGSGSGDGSGPIPAAFPKGYSAFYCMKYEITQGQYVDFLNKLTYDQQNARTTFSPDDPTGTQTMNVSSSAFRQGISIVTPGISNSTPAEYGVDINDDDSFGDGEDNGSAYISWGDLLAFLDWSGLRPMTELEFEKACRGPIPAVNNEYAWGTANIYTSSNYSRTNSGTSSEGFSNIAVGNGNALVWNTAANKTSRVGSIAASATNPTREETGATYYGIMEMTGSVVEHVISVGYSSGRSFDGTHGNGELDASGNEDIGSWNYLSSSSGGRRGGSCTTNILTKTEAELSDRTSGSGASTSRSHSNGGRGVRTAL